MKAAIARTVAELGAVNAVLYYAGQLLSRLGGGRAGLRRYLIVAQPVPARALAGGTAATTAIRQVLAGDPAAEHYPRPPQVIRDRFAAGHTCLEIAIGGQFAGFLWLAFGAYDEDEVRCRYVLADRGLAWDFDVYVEPRHRIGRCFARLWDAANALLRERGVAWSLSRISAFNTASLAAHARLGAVPLGYATFLRLGPLQLAFLPGRRLPALSWNAASTPTVVLAAPAPGTTSAESLRKPAQE